MTKLDKPLRRELDINGEAHVLVISPEGLKLTIKGRRRGQEFSWADLVRGNTALSTALNASLDATHEPGGHDHAHDHGHTHDHDHEHGHDHEHEDDNDDE